MTKVAIIFPGQGSQSVGMGKDLFENSEEAKKIFEIADECLEKNISKICFEGPEEDLKQTINTQPAILTTSIAALEALKANTNLDIAFFAGHSLGEYAAMYAADVVDLKSVIKLIAKRAELMDSAAKSTTGTMAAVLGLSQEKIEQCIESLNLNGAASVANYNSPEQIVITGEIEAMNKAMEALKEAGAKRVIPLPVSGAFHSALMKKAGEEFSNFVKEYKLQDAKIPVITNVDANITISAEEFASKMPTQIYSSVYWTHTIQKMVKEGISTFIEVGPGKVLSGLNKKIDSNITTYNIYDIATLNATIEALKAN